MSIYAPGARGAVCTTCGADRSRTLRGLVIDRLVDLSFAATKTGKALSEFIRATAIKLGECRECECERRSGFYMCLRCGQTLKGNNIDQKQAPTEK